MNPGAEAAIAAAVASARGRAPGSARLVGVGWATVELERAARDLGVETRPAARDVVLGARCASADGPDGTSLVLLEPDTEGRLARTLARFDEGPTVTWWDVDAVDPRAVIGPSPGPLGTFGLWCDDRSEGPWLFLRPASAATITP